MKRTDEPATTDIPREPKKGKAPSGIIRAIRTFFNVAGIVIASATAILVIFLSLLLFLFVADRRNPHDYLPEDFTAFFETDSASRLYGQWLDLAAADTALQSAGLSGYRKSLLEWKADEWSRSPLFAALADCRTGIAIDSGGRPYLVADLGVKSVLSRVVMWAGPWLGVPKLEFVKTDRLSYFKYPAGGYTWHIAFVSNLAIVGISQEALFAGLDLKTRGKALSDHLDQSELATFGSIDRTLRFLVDARELAVKPFSGENSATRLLETFAMEGWGAVGLDLSNESVALDASAPLAPRKPGTGSFLDRAPGKSSIPGILGKDVSFFSYANPGSMKDLAMAAGEIAPGETADFLKKTEEALKLATGMGMEEAVFSWASAEMGMFRYSGFEDPVFFLRVADRGAWENAKKKLFGSLVMGRDMSLLVDSERITKVTLPWYVNAFLGTAGVTADLPYLVERDGYIFVSVDAAALAKTLKPAMETLEGSLSWRETVSGVERDALFFAYYDADSALPPFLDRKNPVSGIIRQYARGAVSVTSGKGHATIRLRAFRSSRNSAKLIPGFPFHAQELGDGLTIVKFQGLKLPTLLWMDSEGVIRGIDTALHRSYEGKSDPGAVILPFSPGNAANGSIPVASGLATLSPDGTVRFFDQVLAVQGMVPSSGGKADGSARAVTSGGDIVYADSARQSISIVTKSGDARSWDRTFDGDIGELQVARDDTVFFRPRAFDAPFYRLDLDGKDLPGWPAEAPLAMTLSPRELRYSVFRGFLLSTESGDLHLYDTNGKPREGWPVSTGRTVKTDPVPLIIKGKPSLAVLTSDGYLLLVDVMSGLTVTERPMEGTDGTRAVVRAFDYDRDSTDEIFISGDSARVRGWDPDTGNSIDGFPVKGNGPVFFVDMDSDGSADLVTAGSRSEIIAWSFR